MVEEVRIYVEGGGDRKDGKTALREGFDSFLGSLKDRARAQGIKLRPIRGGGRRQTYKKFTDALSDHPQAFNVLLVDAEAPVRTKGKTWAHLQQQDGWQRPDGATDDHCHLMVQAMEAWLIADREALREFYGQGFNENAIPARQDVEEIPKDDLEPALKRASRDTTKGEYRKIEHGLKLLGMLDAGKVRKAAKHCNCLFTTIASQMDAAV